MKPNELYAEKSNLIKKGKNAELEIERANERCQYEISRRREFEKRYEALKKENDELKARLDELEQENSELKAFKENYGQKSKGLFITGVNIPTNAAEAYDAFRDTYTYFSKSNDFDNQKINYARNEKGNLIEHSKVLL